MASFDDFSFLKNSSELLKCEEFAKDEYVIKKLQIMDHIFNSLVGLDEKKTDELYIKFHRDSDYFKKIISKPEEKKVIDYFRDDFGDTSSMSSGDIYIDDGDNDFGYIINGRQCNSDDSDSSSSDGDISCMDSEDEDFESDIKEYIGETIIDYNIRMNMRYYGFVRK